MDFWNLLQYGIQYAPEGEDGGGSGSGDGGSDPDPDPEPEPDPEPTGGASESAVEKLRAELKREREERKKAQEKAQQYEDEKKTELEKAREAAEREEQRRKELEARIEQERRNSALVSAASDLGLRHPKKSIKLIDESRVQITEDGVVGAREAIEDLKDEQPYLFKDAGGTTTSDPESGSGKKSDRNEDPSDNSPDDPYESGAGMMSAVKDRKNSSTL